MARSRFGQYVFNILYSVDQFFNTVAGGDPDETISSRLGKMARDGKLRLLPGLIVRFLDRIDADHCKDAIENDEGGMAVCGERCVSAICEGGIVIRCRQVRGHRGPHAGSHGSRGNRKWVSWG